MFLLADYHLDLWICYLIIFELYAAAPDQKEASKFSLSSMLNVAIPALMPPTSEYDRCESLKNFLGLTYEQLQEKNATELTDGLTIDLITKDGTLKYDLTYRIGRILRNSTNIVILIHGFMESSDGWMVQAVAPVLLRKKEYKVLALDGRKIFFIDYLKSSTYVRFIGSKLGTVLAQIIKRGHDPSTISLVGHSLGAHIAGIAGKRVTDLTGRKLGRITGLDPAGPCFSTTTPAGRLDRSDAEYVDVVHTNGGVLGVKEPVGHKDFFPNGGLSQPGCYLSTCDHSRAWELFAESVNASRSFPARLCGNWSMFREGLCSRNEVSYLGLSSSPGTHGAYYLTTGSETPFGLGAAGSG